ncbi:MAG: lectin like domain-containing protein [Thermoplasmatota archaeon]
MAGRKMYDHGKNGCRWALFLFLLVMLSKTTIMTDGGTAGEEQVGDKIPSSFSLLDVDGISYVSAVKSQRGGTCWAHGTMSAMESNLMLSGLWEWVEGEREPDLAEYHLDWWNGFNNHNNDDVETPEDEGLWVHQGGDYQMSTAYLSRGEGAVRDIDGQNYDDPPEREFNSYHEYTPMHVEWYTVDDSPDGMESIKRCLMNHGAMGTSMLSDGKFRDEENLSHYQPPSSDLLLNHAIAIVGWDDEKVTQAPEPGAWLVKNSWGSQWTFGTYFWISYYDKYAGRHPELGAVSFRNVSYLAFDKVYYHDYHGWRDTWENSTQAFNSFTADRTEQLRGVSFFTTLDQVEFTVTLYDEFKDGSLLAPLARITGFEEKRGLHTHMLTAPVEIRKGDDFYIHLKVSNGGIALDRTSKVPLVMGPTREPSSDGWINSSSEPGQSFYLENGTWKDLYDHNNTANFCIKGLVGHVSISRPLEGEVLGPNSGIGGPVSIQMDKVRFRIDDGPLRNTFISGGNWSSTLEGINIPPGEHTLTVIGSQDGFTEITSSTRTGFRFESTPPSTEIEMKGLQGNNSWFRSPVEISLMSTDVAPGVKDTFYSLDHGPEMIYNGSFTVSGEGEHGISFWAKDLADNIEEPSVASFRIDIECPVSGIELEGVLGDNGWLVGNAVFSISCKDNTSGPSQILRRVNEGPWEKLCLEGSDTMSFRFEDSGSYKVSLYAVDEAGNQGEVQKIEFMIDAVEPELVFDLQGEIGEEDWFTSPVRVSLSASDHHSGPGEIGYQFQGGRWEKYTNPLYLDKEGTHILNGKVADLAGLDSDVKSLELKIDTTAPVSSCSVSGNPGENGWYRSNVTVALSSEDKVSGVQKLRYRVNKGQWVDYVGELHLNGSGIHRISYFSVDHAGNTEEISTRKVMIDLRDPLVMVRGPMTPVLRSDNVTLEVFYEDRESGVSKACWTLDESSASPLDGDGDIVLRELTDGMHHLTINVTDLSGRRSSLSLNFLVNTTGYLSLTEETADGRSGEGNGTGPPVLLIIAATVVITAISIPALLIILKRRIRRDPAGSQKEVQVQLEGGDGGGELQL